MTSSRMPLRSDRGAAASPLLFLALGAAAAGLIVGGVLGAIGGIDLVREPSQVVRGATASYYDCPGGEPLGTVHSGDRVFLTGRDATGQWVEVRSPSDVRHRAWIHAAHVAPDDTVGGLPVVPCPASSPTVEVVPSSDTTTTTLDGTTTTVPGGTSTTSATTTTQPPDSTGPSVSNAAASPTQIWEEDGLGTTCPGGTMRQTTIQAHVTDPSGVDSVTAQWSDPDGNHSVSMSAIGSDYSTTIGPYEAGAWDPTSTAPYDHVVSVTITAIDDANNTTQVIVQFTVTEVGECFI